MAQHTVDNLRQLNDRQLTGKNNDVEKLEAVHIRKTSPNSRDEYISLIIEINLLNSKNMNARSSRGGPNS